MRIAICDDNLKELNKTESHLYDIFRDNDEYQGFSVKTFNNGYELLSAYKMNKHFDLIFLDILMPEISGLKLAEKIREIDSKCKIIFLTSSSDFAVESYRYNAYYYMLKNHLDKELLFLLRKLAEDMTQKSEVFIVVKTKGQLLRIHIRDIQFIESLNHKVFFHLQTGKTISTYSSLTTFAKILLQNPCFTKCHKSFIVNMNYVSGIKDSDCVMIDNTIVPISRNLFRQTKKDYLDYFFKEEKRSQC
ncbi:MAG: response regulator transcription factor [Tissierellales bacterium]|nr:response regulator transcription factor [Tissierellales bacterium]MBN2827163.1 response regulator transcription factor [Tissierellales bacterium]